MINFKKILFIIGVIPLLMACKKDSTIAPADKSDTYVGLSIQFPTSQSLRDLSDDYNKKGEWQGRDEIETIDVYLINETTNTIDRTSFTKSSFNAITSDGKLMPNLAVEATAGQSVKAYVVINAEATVKTQLDAATDITDFATKYKEVVDKIASDVATMKMVVSEHKEKVMMTNTIAPVAMNIQANVTKADAIAGKKNRIDIQVERVVSRGIVTIKAGQTELKVKSASGQDISTINITSVKYKIGQSNRKFFLMKKTDWTTPEPVYGYIPNNDHSTKATTYFDYPNTLTEVKVGNGTNNEDIIEAAKAEENSKFVLPVTHADGNYRKGNTTYFEIVATFYPTEIDGQSNSSNEVKTVYLGMIDGKFYSTRAKAESMNAETGDVPTWDKKQQATEYKNGVMKYVLWLNPDKAYGSSEKITKSPTVRNQIYHAYISKFKEIGVPNNPLDPNDPNNPDNPDNPIDPEEPLQTDKTYISVQIKVLPWTIHSYSVDLGNDY